MEQPYYANAPSPSPTLLGVSRVDNPTNLFKRRLLGPGHFEKVSSRCGGLGHDLGCFLKAGNLVFRCFVTFPRPRAEARNCEFPVSGMLFSNAPFLAFGEMKGNTMPGSWNCVLWAACFRGFPWRLETSGMESVARTFGTFKGSGD